MEKVEKVEKVEMAEKSADQAVKSSKQFEERLDKDRTPFHQALLEFALNNKKHLTIIDED